MLLGTEGVFSVSIDCYDTAWSGHLEFEISIVWHSIESRKCHLFEQCVITNAEGDDVEDQVFALEVVRRTEDYFQCYGARTTGFNTRNYSFKGGFCGFDP